MAKRLDAREKEVSAAFHCGEGRQAGDFLAVANQEKQFDLDQAWMLTVTPDDRISAVIAYWDQNQLYRRLGVKRLDQITITAG